MLGERRSIRNVIPRWRAISSIEKRDLESVPRFLNSTHLNSSGDLSDFLSIWRKEETLAAAADIFDSYILTGERPLLIESYRRFKKSPSLIPPRLRDSILLALQRPKDPLESRKAAAFREMDISYLHKSIRVLKNSLLEFPRDALTRLEMARIYTILGEFEKADHQLFLARALAPDDRIILRASLQFQDVVGDLEDGLRLIRSSDRIKFDPWIQSAEIATATLLGKSSKAANHKLITYNKIGQISRERTEFAMAMATLDRDSGLTERKVFQTVKAALPLSTENGFAQAVWLSDQSTRDFSSRFPDIEPANEAYEAKVQLAFDRFDFENSAGFAELWLEDQPFSTIALTRYLNLRSIHLQPDQSAIQWALRGMQVHNDDWHVVNAALLVLTEAGRFDDAQSALTALRRSTPSGPQRAFVDAAEGFLAFARGDFLAGRRSYEAAVKICKSARDNDMLLNALIFWFRCEAGNELLSTSSLNEMIDILDKNVLRASSAQSSYINGVWHSVKKLTKGIHPHDEFLVSNLPTIAKENLSEEENPLL